MPRIKKIKKKLKNKSKLHHIRWSAFLNSGNIKSGEIYKIFSKAGQKINKYDKILEIETDINILEERAPISGYIYKIYVKEEQYIQDFDYIYTIIKK